MQVILLLMPPRKVAIGFIKSLWKQVSLKLLSKWANLPTDNKDPLSSFSMHTTVYQ